MKSKLEHEPVITSITTTPALKRLACLISEKAGSSKRNSLKTGTGSSIAHGYNHALMVAAKVYGLVDSSVLDKRYEQYKSRD